MTRGTSCFKAILACQLDDLFGFAAIEFFSDECGCRAPRAAKVERVERPVEGQQIVAERLDRRDGSGRERKGFGRDTPRNRSFDVVGDTKETRRKMFGDVPASPGEVEFGGDAGTGHQPRQQRMSVPRNRAPPEQFAGGGPVT